MTQRSAGLSSQTKSPPQHATGRLEVQVRGAGRGCYKPPALNRLDWLLVFVAIRTHHLSSSWVKDQLASLGAIIEIEQGIECAGNGICRAAADAANPQLSSMKRVTED